MRTIVWMFNFVIALKSKHNYLTLFPYSDVRYRNYSNKRRPRINAAGTI